MIDWPLFFGVLAGFVVVGALLGRLAGRVADLERNRRLSDRRADERWQVVQERYDAVIDMVAEIAVNRTQGHTPTTPARARTRKKDK